MTTLSSNTPTVLEPFRTTRQDGLDALEFALHRRGNEWHVVYARAYGMAVNRWAGQISSPSTKKESVTHDPPSSSRHLHPRFWLRDGKEFEPKYLGSEFFDFGTMMNTDPPVLADTGIRRTRKCGENDVEEMLVEVLVKEEGLCHRCATCGSWETSSRWDSRHQKVGESGGGRPTYWCGVSLRNR